ncbi:hypothetical protein HWV62_37665 [Athelia sp. TMB]|nr:hypothetical protein HWV62_37665 [Athelia sp. TMB]
MSAGRKRSLPESPTAIEHDGIDPRRKMPKLDIGHGSTSPGQPEQVHVMNDVGAITQPQSSNAVYFATNHTSESASVTNVHGQYIAVNGDYNVTQKIEQNKASEKEVYVWLAAPDPSKNYHAARDSHHTDTGSWFIRGPEFLNWKSRPDRPLWIHGSRKLLLIVRTPRAHIRSSGMREDHYLVSRCSTHQRVIVSKSSTISSSVVEDLMQHCKEQPASAYAYFFFDSRSAESELSLHDKFIRSIVLQLWHQLGRMPLALENIYGKGPSHPQPSITMLQDILQGIIKELDHVYIVIDALDECADRERLLLWAKTMPQWAQGKCHVLLSSRREPDIEDGLDEVIGLQRMSFAGGSANPDIVKYVTEKLLEVKRWNSDIRVMLKQLCQCSNTKALKKQLRDLPKDLEHTYQQLLCETSQPEDILMILQWVVFSARPIEIEELAEVVTIDFRSGELPRYDPDLRYMDPRDVLTVCSGFLTEFDGMVMIKTRIVKLSHMSVKDYLLSDKISNGPAAYFKVKESQSHALIAQTSLAYLLQFGTLDSLCYANIKTYPLAPYAAEYWAFHWRRCTDISPSSPLHGSISHFLLSAPNAYANWTWLVTVFHEGYFEKEWSRERINALSSQISTPLYLSALLGLFEPLKQLLACSRGSSAIEAEWHSRALYLAACEGHHTIVELLINHTPACDLSTMIYQNTPLIVAASQGRAGYMGLLDYRSPGDPMGEEHVGFEIIMNSLLPLDQWGEIDVEIREGAPGTIDQSNSLKGIETTLRLLLERGADINPLDDTGRSALCYASGRGDEPVMRLLLEHGAEVNPQGECESALLEAAANNHETIARLLLQHGADVNAQDGHRRTALWHASRDGYEPIVQLLLEHGADVNLHRQYESALLEAMANNHETIARLLLQHGADVNAQDGKGRTTLWYASRGGYEPIVQLLLEHGADVNIRGNSGSAFQQALANNHETIARLLLQRGADVNFQDGNGRTTLWYASRDGYEPIVQLLLEHGADVNLHRQYESVLLEAMANNRETIARLLLQHGADVNAQDSHGRTALWHASGRARKSIVLSLLEHGADVNIRGDSGSALEQALANNHETIARLLLQRGADVNFQDGKGRTTLWYASRDGYEPIVQLLLEHGADVNLSRRYESALLEAVCNNRETITRLLLQHGADVNAQDSHKRTVLWHASGRAHESVVRLLLEHGADVNPQGECESALLEAVANNHETIARLLLQHGADVNAQDDHGRTALWHASGRARKSIVLSLLEHGADVNIRGDSGSALEQALANNHETTARLLLQHSADLNVNAQDSGGRTALWHASGDGYEPIVQLLLEHGADASIRGDSGSALEQALANNHETTARLLLQHSADLNVNAQDSGGGTALWHAKGQDDETLLQMMSWQGHHNGVKLLLEYGADVNAQGGERGTALCLASRRGHDAIVRTLLGSGADVHINSGRLGSALHAACQWEDETIETLLRSYGAECHAPMEPATRYILSPSKFVRVC